MQLTLPTQTLTYAQLLEWDKNDLAEFILNHTMITHAECHADNISISGWRPETPL